MKAVALTGIGTVSNLHFQQLSTPVPSSDEALLNVLYCGVNHLDLLIRQGKRPGPTTFPHVLGSEIVGKLENAIPSRKLKKGDIVAVYPWTFCGKCEQCKLGNENICDQGGTLGRTTWGGYAQIVAVPIKNMFKIPKNLAPETVAASILAATTAIHLINRASIKNQSSVLVTGPSGAVGISVIQLLMNKKCTVIAGSSHIQKHALLQKLGVETIVSTSNLTSEVLKKYPGGVEFVIDIMGGYVWSQGVEVLSKNGTLVFCSTTLEEPGVVNIGKAFSKQINILGSYGGTIKDMQTVFSYIRNGTVRPVIDTIFPLKDASYAHQKLEDQKVFGKVLLKVD